MSGSLYCFLTVEQSDGRRVEAGSISTVIQLYLDEEMKISFDSVASYNPIGMHN